MVSRNKIHYVIVGGGIIGSSIAREIVSRKLGSVTVLDKEKRLGLHASGRNSGVIHSGINQKQGTLKAKMCVDGNKKLLSYCKANNVKFNQCGTVVIARNIHEQRVIRQLLIIGKEAGVQGLKIVNKDELFKVEPDIIATEALISPTGAVVDSLGLLKTVADDAISQNADYIMGAEVCNITKDKIITTKGEFNYGHLINCAGLYSDKIAHMMDVALDYTIIPFRGEYMEVKNLPINSMVYQAPNLKYPFLGVHLTRTVDNKILAGPTATLSFGRESYNKEINVGETLNMALNCNFLRLIVSKEFLNLAYNNAKMSLSRASFLTEIQKLTANKIGKRDIIPYRSGIRAQLVDNKGNMVNDIKVEFLKNSTHILNAVSPGLTCSLAFAEWIVNNLTKNK